MNENIAIYLQLFGEAATWTTANGVSTAVTVVYSDDRQLVEDEGWALDAITSKAQGKTAELGSVSEGDTITLRSTNYRVLTVRPDGANPGWTVVYLGGHA